jgi:putative transposase
MVLRAIPVIRDTAAIPPQPATNASLVAKTRRCRSSRYGLSVSNRRHIAASLITNLNTAQPSQAQLLYVENSDSIIVLRSLTDAPAFARRLAELKQVEWVVYAKRSFAGPAAGLAYLGRYTHRVAIANSRLIALAGGQVSFRWCDYRHYNKAKGMTLAADEFIRRFLLHALPDGFHRIRHYGFLANRGRADKLALCRSLIAVTAAASLGGSYERQRLADRALMSVRLRRTDETDRPVPSLTADALLGLARQLVTYRLAAP